MGNLVQKPGELVLETSGHYMTPDPLVPDEVGTLGRVTRGFLDPRETVDRRLEAKGITDSKAEPKAGNIGADSDLASRGAARRYQVGKQEAHRLVHGRKGAPFLKPIASGGAPMEGVPTPDSAAAPIQLE
jgi:hypothetical protein